MKVTTNKFRSYGQLKAPGIRAAAVYAVYVSVLSFLLLSVAMYYGRDAVMPMGTEQPPVHPKGGFPLMGFVVTYFFVFFLFWINFSLMNRPGKRPQFQIGWSVVVSLLFIVVWNVTWQHLPEVLLGFEKISPHAIRGGRVKDLLMGIITFASAQLIYASYRRQQMALAHKTLQAEYEQARYQALENQINPHFLFNSLNALYALVGKDTGKSKEYIQRLSAIFRYTMQNREISTVADELAFTDDYCTLLRLRYGDNVDFCVNVPAQYADYKLAPFGIQTLVENAVKHNVISSKNPLEVCIGVEDDFLVVSNLVCSKQEATAGRGIGLANLNERYQLKWHRSIEIRNEGGRFTVRIPLISPF